MKYAPNDLNTYLERPRARPLADRIAHVHAARQHVCDDDVIGVGTVVHEIDDDVVPGDL
jgi:hypothetical protein